MNASAIINAALSARPSAQQTLTAALKRAAAECPSPRALAMLKQAERWTETKHRAA